MAFLPIASSITVVTGASSGIGLAVSQALARQGARMVLAAREEEALDEAVRECHRAGGRAIPVSADISLETGAGFVAERAFAEFGRIDCWINNAAVSLFGRIEELPWATFEQVVRTNLFGYVHGVRAVLPHFRSRGRGLLINVASVVGCVGQPDTSAYVVGKWGIRGLGECLRMELRDVPDIRCCTLLPAAIDTPIFRNAGNYTGREARAMPPVLKPSSVAAAVVELYARPRREKVVGAAGRAVIAAHAVLPGLVESVMARQVARSHFTGRAAPRSDGNVFRPGCHALSGGWRRSEANRLGRIRRHHPSTGDPGRFRSIRTEVDGVTMHARVSPSSGAGPALVLVHGLALSGRYMMPTAHLLAKRHRVLVPDLPGFGDSDKPRRILNVPELAAALAGWLDAMATGPVILIGNSQACQVIGALAAVRSDLVASAILQGPTTPPEERTWLRQYVCWRRNAPYNPPELSPLSYDDYRKAGYVRSLATFHLSLKDRLEDKLPALLAPTLVVRGQHDPICHQGWAERLARELPDGRLVIVPGVAHTLVFTAPVELAAVCEAFIGENVPASRSPAVDP